MTVLLGEVGLSRAITLGQQTVFAAIFASLMSTGAFSQNCTTLETDTTTYYLCKEASTYQQARSSAEALSVAGESGYLAIIDSASENTRIRNFLGSATSSSDYSRTSADDGGGAAYVWLGGDDQASEGRWVWQKAAASGYPKQFWQGGPSGSARNGLYNNWGTDGGTRNEPDNYLSNQDGVAIALQSWPRGAGFTLGSAGQWNDVNTSNRLYYLVEFDAVEGSSSSGGSGSGSSGSGSGSGSGSTGGSGAPGTPEEGDPVGGCNQSFVTIAKTTISVAPTGNTDTDNIQCALDAAIDGEYSTIKLTEGTFYVGPLFAQGFQGTIQGKTKASTVIVALDEAFACNEASDAGTYAAMFKFTLGEPQIKFMTLQASQPCQGSGFSDATRFVFIHFNNDTSNCNKRTMFPKVDRVSVLADYIGGDEPRITGVMASADAACFDKPLLGKVLVNRSDFSGLAEAVQTTLGGAAQVDISFNTFSANAQGVVIAFANQITNIVNNTFNIDNGRNHGFAAGVLQYDDKGVNRTVIDANTFNVANVRNSGGQVFDDNVYTPAVLVLKAYEGVPKGTISVLISNNKLNFSSPDFGGLWVQDTDSGIISGNRFSGTLRGEPGEPTNFMVMIDGVDFPEVTGWSIVDNDFSGVSDCGALLQNETAGFVIGPDQSCNFFNNGSGNFILE